MSEHDSTATEETEEVTEDTTDTDADALEADDDAEPDWRKNFDPDKAASRITKLQSEAKNLRTRAKEAEDKAKGVGEKDTRISALEAQNLRYEVAFDLGLPKELANRLQGSTKDEMLADAETLVKLVGSPKPVTRKPSEALRGGGPADDDPVETDLQKIGERMFRR